MKFHVPNASIFCRHLIIFSLFAFFLFLLFPDISFAQKISTIKKETIAPGVTFTALRSIADSTNVYELKVNLKKGNYIFTALKAGDKLKARETTSSMAARASKEGLNVIAAVNADFFNMKNGENENNMIINGRFERAVNPDFYSQRRHRKLRSQFAFTLSGKPLIGKYLFSGKILTANDKELKIDQINSYPDSNSVSLYNVFQGNMPKIPADWKRTEYYLNRIRQAGDTVFASVEYNNGKKSIVSIGKNEYLLCGFNAYADSLSALLKPNGQLKLILSLRPEEGAIRTLLGGCPRLIVNGKSVAAESDSLEGTSPNFSRVKHPRTGIGFSKDSTTIYLFAVDGRSESNSGMSLTQFADFMLARGVYQGINFDGGGSTTMYVKGNVVNHPSDKTGERAVGNCLLLIKK